MLAKARRWGNSLALRLRKKDVETAGISDGDLVKVDLVRVTKKGAVVLRNLPTFEDDDPEASVKHDRYLYG